MVVMMIVMVALGTIAGLTVISVQGGAATTNAQRFSSMALYAAESGAAAAMQYLKSNVHRADAAQPYFSDLVNKNNDPPNAPAEIPGNNILPGVAGNLLSNDQQGWYEVALLNNPNDRNFSADTQRDFDGIIRIQVTGHGPNGAMKKIEWEVRMVPDLDTGNVVGRPLVLLGWRELL
jgi:hypothetical protein